MEQLKYDRELGQMVAHEKEIQVLSEMTREGFFLEVTSFQGLQNDMACWFLFPKSRVLKGDGSGKMQILQIVCEPMKHRICYQKIGMEFSASGDSFRGVQREQYDSMGIMTASEYEPGPWQKIDSPILGRISACVFSHTGMWPQDFQERRADFFRILVDLICGADQREGADK